MDFLTHIMPSEAVSPIFPKLMSANQPVSHITNHRSSLCTVLEYQIPKQNPMSLWCSSFVRQNYFDRQIFKLHQPAILKVLLNLNTGFENTVTNSGFHNWIWIWIWKFKK